MTKVERLRKIIFGSLVTIVVIVLGYSLLYSLDLLPSFGEEPERYVVLERDLEVDPLVVEEFFTFSCEHCRNFDPLLLDWADSRPPGVEFVQTHVAFTRTDQILAKTHLVLEARDAVDANRDRIFTEIHDKQNRFLTTESVAEFVHGNGITRAAFMSLYQGDRMSRLATEKASHTKDIGVLGVPFVLVGNKYGVYVGQARKEAIATIKFLVGELLAGREPLPLRPKEEEVAEDLNLEETTEEASIEQTPVAIEEDQPTAVAE